MILPKKRERAPQTEGRRYGTRKQIPHTARRRRERVRDDNGGVWRGFMSEPFVQRVDNTVLGNCWSPPWRSQAAPICLEMDSIGHLPVAVHRALDEKVLRNQRDRAEKDLRRSEARYRALAGNLSYGICRSGLDGSFLEVNEAMIRMLGYESKEEVLVLDLVREIIQDPLRLGQLLGYSGENAQVDPIEMEWRRKDQTNLKVRLSGREVLSEQGELEAYEIIAEDVTRQREVEDHLRRLAASDSLTGLANYRHLVDVLDFEIKRSNRTNRQFALLFFDMDGLKRINDRHGHMDGSQD